MGDLYDLAEAIKAKLDEQAAAAVALTKAARVAVTPLVLDPDVEIADEELASIAPLFPPWVAGETVVAGAVRSWDGTLVECLQGHTTQSDWTPDVTPALWKIHRAAGSAPAPWVRPTGGHDAYNIGDPPVTFNGKVYETIINANVWSPTEYPAGWREVT